MSSLFDIGHLFSYISASASGYRYLAVVGLEEIAYALSREVVFEHSPSRALVGGGVESLCSRTLQMSCNVAIIIFM